MLLKFSDFSSRLAGSVVVIMPAGGASRRGSTLAPCFLIISFFRLRKKKYKCPEPFLQLTPRVARNTLQAESPSIFLDKSGRGRRLCERLQDSLIRRSSEKMDESVQFPVGQTVFLLTRMIIHLSGFSTAICMYKCRDHVNCTRANKLSLRVFSWCYRLFTLQNY